MKRFAWLTVLILVVPLSMNCGDDGGGSRCNDSFKAFARDHYSRERFERYVRDTIVVFSGFDNYRFCTDPSIYDSSRCWQAIHETFPLSEEDDSVFYEQVGRDDNYIFGWDDWDPYGVQHHQDLWVDWEPYSDLPTGIPNETSNRSLYRDLYNQARECWMRLTTCGLGPGQG